MSDFYTHKIHREVPTKQQVEGGVTTNRIEGAFSSRHFIGDGVPSLEEGFSLGQLDPHNPRDFMIQAGRILAHGIEVILDNDINYNGQPARVDSTITPAVPALPDPPSGGATDEQVWLDVWEFPADDDSQPLEIRWAVRARDVANPPESRDPDFLELADHHYLHIAHIVRTETNITITDLRRNNLALSSVVDEIQAARGSLDSLDTRLSVALFEDGSLRAKNAIDAVLNEVSNARGTQGSLDARLDFSLAESGSLKAQGDIDAVLNGVSRLENEKLNRAGDTISGSLTVDGDVGIGTSSPSEKLHIEGSVRGNKNGALRINTGTGFVDIGPQNVNYSQFITDRPKFYFNKEISVDGGRIGSHDEDLQLCTSGNRRLTISNITGNVGIGLSTPTRKLEIKRAGNNTEFSLNERLFLDGQSGTVRLTNNAYKANASWAIKDPNKKAFTLEIRNSGMLELYGTKTNGSADWLKLATFDAPNERVVFPSGNVGIGTSSPNRQLTIYHRKAAYQNVKDGSHEILMGVDQTGGIVSVMTNHDLVLRAGANKEKMRIKANGRVGIGTNNPSAHLHATNGAILGHVAIAVDPPGAIRFPYAYETVGTTNTRHNLRLHSYNGIFFHVNNQQAPSRGVSKNGQWYGSTRELKEKIRHFSGDEAIKILEGLNPIKFVYKADEDKKEHIGFIAEDVPEVIASPDRKMISEMDIIAVLTSVMKRLQEEITDMRNRPKQYRDREGMYYV